MKVSSFRKDVSIETFDSEVLNIKNVDYNNSCFIPIRNLSEIKLNTSQVKNLLEDENNMKIFASLHLIKR